MRKIRARVFKGTWFKGAVSLFVMFMAFSMMSFVSLAAEGKVKANTNIRAQTSTDSEVVGSSGAIDRTAYLTIAKLTAILKIANGLDRSHKQKFKNVKTTLKEETLVITVDASVDITLEKGLFTKRAEFFEEVYSVKPVIRQRG